MKPSWQYTLKLLSRPEFSAALKGIHRGIEKESLRVKDMVEQELEINAPALTLAKKHSHKLRETDSRYMQPGGFIFEAVASRQKQRELEKADTTSFDDFLRLTFGSFPSAPSPSRRFCGARYQLRSKMLMRNYSATNAGSTRLAHTEKKITNPQNGIM